MKSTHAECHAHNLRRSQFVCCFKTFFLAVSMPILHHIYRLTWYVREIYKKSGHKIKTQNDAIPHLHRNAVKGVDNAMPCHRTTGYDIVPTRSERSNTYSVLVFGESQNEYKKLAAFFATCLGMGGKITVKTIE